MDYLRLHVDYLRVDYLTLIYTPIGGYTVIQVNVYDVNNRQNRNEHASIRMHSPRLPFWANFPLV